ncbi:MAG: hypothetical protein JXA20_14900 [Spirochaetes bacterium]|nr:hypothetical protein [Spirochaetota bacterium]
MDIAHRTAYLCCVLCLLLSCASGIVEGEVDPMKAILSEINGEPVVPRAANRLYLAEVRNMTDKAALEEKFVIRLKEEVNSDGRLVVVEEKDRSDLLLEIALREYTIQNIEYDSMGQPVKKRMRIMAGAVLFDLEKKRMVFSDPSIQAYQTYSDIVPPLSTEYQVMDAVTRELAKRIAAKTVSGWYTQYMDSIEKSGE